MGDSVTIRGGTARLSWIGSSYEPNLAVLASSGSEVVQGRAGSRLVAPNADSLFCPVIVSVQGASASPSRVNLELDPGEVAPFSGYDLVIKTQQAELRDGSRGITWPAAAGGNVALDPVVERWSSAAGRWTCTRYLVPPTAPGIADIPVPAFARRFRLYCATTSIWLTTPFGLYGADNRYMAQYPYREIQAAFEGEWLDLPAGCRALYSTGAPVILVPPTANEILAVQFECEVSR